MLPLYDRTVTLVGWQDGSGHLFGLGMEWIAFTAGAYVFSAQTIQWLGLRQGLSILDRNGLPVLWSPGAPIASALRQKAPMRPKIPLRPKTPMRPMTPLRPPPPKPPVCGWSPLLFADWLVEGQNLGAQVAAPVEPAATRGGPTEETAPPPGDGPEQRELGR